MARFTPPDAPTTILNVYADALGVWSENGRTVAFYFEHDTGTEALTVLADKIRRYDKLKDAAGGRWPVLFWLHSARREANLHKQLIRTGSTVLVATAARDRLNGLSPAERIWQVHGAASPLLSLAELPMSSPVDVTAFDREDPPAKGMP